MKRALVLYPDSLLTQPTVPVEALTFEVMQLIEDMAETMYAAKGVGLAAPQVGQLLQIFVMDTTWEKGAPNLRVFINPKITASGGMASIPEGCLSIPRVRETLPRHEGIIIQARNMDFEEELTTVTGLDAVCAQHEYDHLLGILFIDKLSRLRRTMAFKKAQRKP